MIRRRARWFWAAGVAVWSLVASTALAQTGGAQPDQQAAEAALVEVTNRLANFTLWLAVATAAVAIATAFLVAFTWIIGRREHQLARLTQSVAALMELKRDFFQDEYFVEIRRRAAAELLGLRPWQIPHASCMEPTTCAHRDPPKELTDVLNFFDIVGLLVKRGALDLGLVQSVFGFWLRSYHLCATEYLARGRQTNPDLWCDFGELCASMFPKGTTGDLSDGQILAFRDRFLRLECAATRTSAVSTPLLDQPVPEAERGAV